jgi:hypothetical protein
VNMAKQKRTSRARATPSGKGKAGGGESSASASTASSVVAKIASNRGRSSGHLKKARRQVKHQLFLSRKWKTEGRTTEKGKLKGRKTNQKAFHKLTVNLRE